MDNMTLFFCGVVVTLIAGIGIVTSEVFLGYERFMRKNKQEDKIKTIKLNRRNVKKFIRV